MCIFCKIVNNEIPSYKIYEDNHTIAILDIQPYSIGHTLVIPRIHNPNIWTTNLDTLSHISTAIYHVANILKSKLNISDLNIIQNNGKLAGQEVDHIHFHLIPRYVDDDINFTQKHIKVDLSNIHSQIIGNISIE